jgi:hypothetical protein
MPKYIIHDSGKDLQDISKLGIRAIKTRIILSLGPKLQFAEPMSNGVTSFNPFVFCPRILLLLFFMFVDSAAWLIRCIFPVEIGRFKSGEGDKKLF